MSTESHELVLFIENDGALYRQMTQPIFKNLVKKKKNGTYIKELGVKAFRNLADEGAKRYLKQNQTRSRDNAKWYEVFSTSDRDAAARELERDFSNAYANGEHK